MRNRKPLAEQDKRSLPAPQASRAEATRPLNRVTAGATRRGSLEVPQNVAGSLWEMWGQGSFQFLWLLLGRLRAMRPLPPQGSAD